MKQRVGQAPQAAVSKEEHEEWARKLWQRIDRDNSDEITRDELCCDEFQGVLRSIIAPDSVGQSVATYGRSEINLERALNYILAKADKNNDGVLSFKEFVSFLRFMRNETRPEHLSNIIFALFDLDNNNQLDKEELREIFKYFLGHHAPSQDIRKAWVAMDPSGLDYITKEAFLKWLKGDPPAAFKQHVAPVIGSAPSSDAGDAAPRRSPKAKAVFRPAPGCLPPRERTKSAADDVQPNWNSRFAAKDPCAQNLAWRGNQRMKTFFSRPQSLPELHRFYCTYTGFEKNREKLRKPEPFADKRKLVQSADNVMLLTMPGAGRHKPGGRMRNTLGEEVPWRENTPRALIRPVWAPGSLLLRMPGEPAPHITQGRDADV